MAVTRYDISLDYSKDGGNEFSSSPYWCLAVYRLGRPVSYSRRDKKSLGNPITGSLLRKEEPFVITSDCIGLTTSGNTNSYLKNMNATLKGGYNYLSANFAVTGDWVMAWMFTNKADRDRIVTALKNGAPANDFHSGIKFIGRISNIGKRISVSNGIKAVNYSIMATGFEELSTSFFYDPAMRTKASQTDIFQFLSEIGIDAFEHIKSIEDGGSISLDDLNNFQDNSEKMVESFLSLIIGKTKQFRLNESFQDDKGNAFSASPQLNTGAPFSYLIPVGVATTLGSDSSDARKGTYYGHRSYGYCDILQTIFGVQKYSTVFDPTDKSIEHFGFLPDIENLENTNGNRLRTGIRMKGTYIPVEPVFLNKPLWDILGEFKNPCINEMYTCLKPNLIGRLMPTIVYRQIAMSTEAMVENPSLPLTRFLSVPRWVVPNSMITDLNIGRNGATKHNFIHVYGQVSPVAQTMDTDLGNQMLRNAPISDVASIAVHGLRPYMSSVAASLHDVTREDGSRVWMEAMADWIIGSEHTLNGSVTCKGIQSPVAEGDNCEIDNIVFKIEGVSHSCHLMGDRKTFVTTLTLTNGMPVEQGIANDVAPRYPGFAEVIDQSQERDDDPFSPVNDHITEENNEGDDSFNTNMNPGLTIESE